MPDAVINDAHLDWTSRYDSSSARRVSGFTSTPTDTQSAKAFKIHWSPRGDGVEMLFKPSVSHPRWLGRNHLPESPGFFLLPQVPPGKPDAIPGKKKVMAKQYIRQMLGAPVLRQVAAYQGARDAELSMKWLRECATKGYIPYQPVEDGDHCGVEANNFGSWGPKALVGIPGRTGEFFIMQDNPDESDASFWAFPEDLRQCIDTGLRDVMLQRQQLCGIPNLRYADESPAAARQAQAVARDRASESKQDANDDADAAPVSPSLAVSQNLNGQFEEAAALVQWGADFAGCVTGHFAVTHEEFKDGVGGAGVNIYKIEEVVRSEEQGEDRSYFTTRQKLVPSKKGVMVYEKKCLECAWHKVRIPTMKVMGWQVAYYFTKLTKGSKIPSAAKVLKLAEEHDLVLFKQPEERLFPVQPRNALCESDDDETDPDEGDSE